MSEEDKDKAKGETERGTRSLQRSTQSGKAAEGRSEKIRQAEEDHARCKAAEQEYRGKPHAGGYCDTETLKGFAEATEEARIEVERAKSE